MREGGGEEGHFGNVGRTDMAAWLRWSSERSEKTAARQKFGSGERMILWIFLFVGKLGRQIKTTYIYTCERKSCLRTYSYLIRIFNLS